MFDLITANIDPVQLPLYWWRIIPYTPMRVIDGVRYAYWPNRWRRVEWKRTPNLEFVPDDFYAE